MTRLFSHISLSALMLLTVTGLTVNLHFCNEHLFDVAFNAPASSCCEAHTHDMHCTADAGMDHSAGCKDKTIEVKTTGEYFVSTFTCHFENDHTIDLFTAPLVLFNVQEPAEAFVPEVLYSRRPPTVPEVDLSQIQTYLI